MIAVRVDDHVCADLQALVQARGEGSRQPPITGMGHHVLDPQLASQLGRPVRAPVIDHDQLDRVEASQLSRQVIHGPAQRLGLIEAWDLNGQFHPV
jgi:hypothetical protein